jgi:hypothetical protein
MKCPTTDKEKRIHFKSLSGRAISHAPGEVFILKCGMKVSSPSIEISDELWRIILSFADKVEYSRSLIYGQKKSNVLRYSAVCRAFSKQCLSLLQKISLTDVGKSVSDERSVGTRGSLSSFLRLLLSNPVSVKDLELAGRHDLTSLQVVDCEAVAACKELRSLTISSMKAASNFKIIGDSCQKLEQLSLHFSGKIHPLESFPQVKSLEYRFITSPDQLFEGLHGRKSIFPIPNHLPSHFADWANLVELTGDFLVAGMISAGVDQLVSLLPNLASYTELDRCPERTVESFARICNGKPIARTLKTLNFPRGFVRKEGDNNGSDSAAREIFRTFRNLNYLEINSSGITLSDMETVLALSRLTSLETLDLNGNEMFFGGDEDKVNEWLRTCLPLFPKSLEVIDFSGHSFDEYKYELSELITEKICKALPGAYQVECNPRQASSYPGHYGDDHEGYDIDGDDDDDDDDVVIEGPFIDYVAGGYGAMMEEAAEEEEEEEGADFDENMHVNLDMD